MTDQNYTTFKVTALVEGYEHGIELFGDFTTIEEGKQVLTDWATELGAEVTGWKIFRIDGIRHFGSWEHKVTRVS